MPEMHMAKMLSKCKWLLISLDYVNWYVGKCAVWIPSVQEAYSAARESLMALHKAKQFSVFTERTSRGQLRSLTFRTSGKFPPAALSFILSLTSLTEN